MSADADTHTAATAYGEVEIEVVECASCGQTVQRSAAQDVIIGDVQSQTTYGALGHVSVDVDDRTYWRGHVCETCQQVGLIDIPGTALLTRYWRAIPLPARVILAGFILTFIATGALEVPL